MIKSVIKPKIKPFLGKPLWVVFLIFGLAGAQAQDVNNPNIQAFRIGFYTKRLMLTPDEAKGFWPVHDAYSKELRKTNQASKSKLNEIAEGLLSLSDQQLSDLGDELLDLKQAEFDLVKKYHGEFKKVLPIRKVLMLYKVEQDYKKELLEEIKRRRQERLKNRRNH